MNPEVEGFAFLRPADWLVSMYLSTSLAVENRHFIDDLWARIHPHDPLSYCGISCMVDGIPPCPDEDESSWLAHFNVDPSDPLAKMRVAIGQFSNEAYADTDWSLLFNLEHVQRTLELIPPAERIQIVRVRRSSYSSENSVLGFDVGYWGGDHYSIICDSIVTPTWHPPQPEDFAALAEALDVLNDSLLLPTEAEAAAFRRRYMQFSWSETETCPDEFEIIQVEAVESRGPLWGCS